MSINIRCPLCDARLTACLTHGRPVRGSDPSEPPDLDDLTGCEHCDDLLEDESFMRGLFLALQEEEEAAYDREMDRRIEVERERRWSRRGEPS